MRRIAVVGGGHAGVQVVASLRDEGYEGEIVLFSAETELPYHRPPLSKTFLLSLSEQLKPLRAESFYAANRIELELGQRIAGIDKASRRLFRTNGSSIDVDAVVLAPGANARRLMLPGAELAGIEAVRDAADAFRLRERLGQDAPVVIIGAGLIGLEIASCLSTPSRSVIVVEASDRILERIAPPEISVIFEDFHRSWGVEFRFKSTARAFLGSKGIVEGVLLDSGEVLQAGTVIVAVGAEPRLELMKSVGVVCTDGVRVDKEMRTTIPNILAAGDCVTVYRPELNRFVRLESVQSATEQARTAARSLLGKSPEQRTVPWFWSDQRDSKLQIAGLPRPLTQNVLLHSSDGNCATLLGFSDNQLSCVFTINSPGDHMAARRALAGGAVQLAPSVASEVSFDFKEWCKSPRDRIPRCHETGSTP